MVARFVRHEARPPSGGRAKNTRDASSEIKEDIEDNVAFPRITLVWTQESGEVDVGDVQADD